MKKENFNELISHLYAGMKLFHIPSNIVIQLRYSHMCNVYKKRNILVHTINLYTNEIINQNMSAKELLKEFDPNYKNYSLYN